jgi:hypothetical protein
MNILFKDQYSIFATRISWADFNDIEQKSKNSGEPYLNHLFLSKRDASLYQLNAVGVLIYLTDSISKKTFLVDTGAAVSVFPHSGPTHKADSYLTGPDNKPIRSWAIK